MRSAWRRSKAARRRLATASGQAAETLTITRWPRRATRSSPPPRSTAAPTTSSTTRCPSSASTCSFVDADDFDGLRAAINAKTRAVYTETLGNPKLDVADIEKLAAIAHEHKLPLVIDNTCASPALVRPIEWGADIVVNSATKFLGGHGTAIGGVIVDAGKFDWAASGRFKDFTEPDPSYHGLSLHRGLRPAGVHPQGARAGLRDTGAALSPFNAFLLLQGIETLHLRMERHSQNALAVAKHLEQHPGVEWVNYPGLESSHYYARAKKYLPTGQSSLVTFGIKGGYDAGKKLINSLKLFSLLANIGDAKSLVIHPARPRISSFRRKSRRQRALRRKWCGSPSASRTFATSLPTSIRRSKPRTDSKFAGSRPRCGGTIRQQ